MQLNAVVGARPFDPQHSRPLDVHRWSDHPEVKEVCNQLWASSPFDEFKDPKRSGPRPKKRFKDQLRVLLLDLYVAWKTDPTLSLGVRMGMAEWKTASRYNALFLSNVIPKIIHKLHELEMIHLSKGSYTKPGSRSNRTTRIMAADPLIALFCKHDVSLENLEPPRSRELIVLRNDKNKDMEYEDTDKTSLLRTQMRSYNELLWSTFIDLPGHEVPIIERPIKEGPRMGETQRIPVGGTDYAVRRIFSRGSWECNGRLFGGWWQLLSKDLRQQIYINDEPTVEVDFKGLHIAILSHEKGKPLEGDPYALPGNPFPPQILDPRNAIKKLILTAINAKSAKAAYQAFRSGFQSELPEAHLTNAELSHAIDLFTEKHPHLKECLFADEGIRLMHIDSQIASIVVNRLTNLGIPALCIHDSFIVQQKQQEALMIELDHATTHTLGSPFKTSTTQGHRFHDPLYDGAAPAPGQLSIAQGYEFRLNGWDVRQKAWDLRQKILECEEEDALYWASRGGKEG